MIGQEARETERKIAAILKVLSSSSEPLGGRVISRKLKELGVNLSERGVRYHLKIMDERGLTRSVGNRDGRSITPPGLEELKSALVWDKIGFLTSKIELLAYLTSYDSVKNIGKVPIDITIFRKEDFQNALYAMAKVFKSDYCTCDLVAVAMGGDKLGEAEIPENNIGLATVSSLVVNGSLLKSGVPFEPLFSGVLQIKNYEAHRFVELIEYKGSTIDPQEVFISSLLTKVSEAVKQGMGKVLASYNEIPMLSCPQVEAILEKLQQAGLYRAYILGRPNESICEVPVKLNKVGIILFSGLNPVAAAAEVGINLSCKPMNTVIDVNELRSFWSL